MHRRESCSCPFRQGTSRRVFTGRSRGIVTGRALTYIRSSSGKEQGVRRCMPVFNGGYGSDGPFFAQGRRVFITRGTVSDTDYQGDNRTDATYREQFDSDKGSSADWSAGLGWELLRKQGLPSYPCHRIWDQLSVLFSRGSQQRFRGVEQQLWNAMAGPVRKR